MDTLFGMPVKVDESLDTDEWVLGTYRRRWRIDDIRPVTEEGGSILFRASVVPSHQPTTEADGD